MAKEITSDNLQGYIDSGKPVMIDFWAEWCGPCRMIAPIVEEIAEEFGEKAVVGKCDIEADNALAMKYKVRNIPTIIFIKDGEVVDRQVGVASKEALEEKLNKLL